MVDRPFKVKKMLLDLAQCMGLEVSFKKVRRKTDIAFLKLYGDRRRVLALPPVLEDIFDQEDIEIVQGANVGSKYVLTFAVTEKLERQVRLPKEKRLKLRKLEELSSTFSNKVISH